MFRIRYTMQSKLRMKWLQPALLATAVAFKEHVHPRDIDVETTYTYVDYPDKSNLKVALELLEAEKIASASVEGGITPNLAVIEEVSNKHSPLESIKAKIAMNPEFFTKENRSRRLQGATVKYENIRIHTHVDADAVLSDELKNSLLSAVAWLEEALRVVRVTSKLELSGGTAGKCYRATIPNEYISPNGVDNVEYILFITTLTGTSNSCGSNTLGWAVACESDYLDRPIAGQLNVCRDAFDGTQTFNYITNFFVHEVLHAFGFSNSYFPFFRNPFDDMAALTPRTSNGQPQYNSVTKSWNTAENTITRSTTGYGADVFYLVTPITKLNMKSHFKCGDIVGAPLEDEGSSGTAGSHFEKRIFGPEVMTGVVSRDPLITALSLGVLEDSGWYVPNYSVANELLWGRHEVQYTDSNCAFAKAENKCPIVSGQALTASNTFCNVQSSTDACSHDARSLGRCKTSNFMNDCATQAPYTTSGLVSDCTAVPSTGAYVDTGNSFRSANSRCLDSTLRNSMASGKCYPMTCVAHKQLSEQYGFMVWDSVRITAVESNSGTGKEVTCKASEMGLSKSFDGISGAVACPDVAKVCHGFPCQANGYWKHKKCTCVAGRIGQYCQYTDTKANRLQVPAKERYVNSGSTLIVGQTYHLPLEKVFRSETVDLLGGASEAVFQPVGMYTFVSNLPAGMRVDKDTGAIIGSPTTADNACKVYTIAAIGQNGEQERTIIELRVVASSGDYAAPTTHAAARIHGCTKLAPTVSASTIQAAYDAAATSTYAPDILGNHVQSKVVLSTTATESYAVPPLVREVTVPRKASEIIYTTEHSETSTPEKETANGDGETVGGSNNNDDDSSTQGVAVGAALGLAIASAALRL